ncbi:MAG: hypothetical protein A3K67_03705 [Euryarchaeota archaeon RBG_16_62_10]|nr:MAG: hypothetical protein A3K67_03705 [Euryarchaeota archaeon RBG_16_62_10]
MVPPIPPEASREIEQVKSLVARHFPVYDVRVNYDVVQFYCTVDKSSLEAGFEELREEMSGHGYIPMITYDKGEHIVTVARKPDAKYKSAYVNIVLLIVTFLTTLAVGTLTWDGYVDADSSEYFSADNIAMGALTFTLPLMGILGTHEFGHYFAARRRKVAASLPFFIPGYPLGTFGAFISIRDPIPNRKVMLEIGVAGPLAGMLVALPLGVLGLMLTNSEGRLAPTDIDENMIGIVFPLIYSWLENLVPMEGDFLLHPTAFAAWVGFLVTSINLLPFGQLDGGHVARALLGPKAKYLSWATLGALVIIGFVYVGWLLFALIILFIASRQAPPLNDISKLDLKRIGAGMLAFAVLIVAFVPQPMVPISPDYSFDLVPLGPTNSTISPGDRPVFSVLVNNTGNALNEITFIKHSSPLGWVVAFKTTEENYSESYILELSSGERATLEVMVISPTMLNLTEDNATVVIKALAEDLDTERTISYNFTVAQELTSASVASQWPAPESPTTDWPIATGVRNVWRRH